MKLTAERLTTWSATLGALADLLNANPEIPPPDALNTYGVEWFVIPAGTWSLDLTDEQAQAAREQVHTLMRVLPVAKWHKSPGEIYRFTGELYGVPVEICCDRPAVCERVVTGTREVTKQVPAPDAPMVEVTEVVEDFEWRCEPLLPRLNVPKK